MNVSRLRTGLVVLIALLHLPTYPALAASPVFDDAKLANIPAKMQPFVDRNEIAGVVTCVATKDGIAHLAATGYADLEEKRPMKTDTIVWIASMTKSFTGVAVMMLKEEGRLALDDPASKFVPELANMKMEDGSPSKPILIRHLLNHRSGLPENTDEESRAAKRMQDFVDGFTQRPMLFEPDSRWLYNQSGINTLGRIIEVVSGERYEDFLDKRLLKPLGMKDTTFYLNDEQFARSARSYKPQDGKLARIENPVLIGTDARNHDRAPRANGGLFSTATDISKFARMLLNDGELDGHRYLKAATIQKMRTLLPQEKPKSDDEYGWGLGLMIVNKPNKQSESLSPGAFGHNGAHGTRFFIDPDRDAAFIVLPQTGAPTTPEVQSVFFTAATEAIE